MWRMVVGGEGRRVECIFGEGRERVEERRGTCHVLSGLGHGSLQYFGE